MLPCGNKLPTRQPKPAITTQVASDSKSKPDIASHKLFSIDSSRRVHINGWIPTLPEFLIKENFHHQLQSIRRSIDKTSDLKPLLPQPIASKLIQNSFCEIRASFLFDLPYFLELLDAQYASSSSDSAGNPGRWAIVNATTALAVRFKTAPGAEDEIAPIASAYFGNAAAVMQDLTRLSPTILSIQALICMALFIEHEPQTATFALISSTAAQQLHWLRNTSHANSEAFLRLCVLTDELNSKVSCHMYE